MHKIGFIGLGLMGSAIVSRLLDLGYPVTVMGRRNRTPIELAVKRGASEATSGEELRGRARSFFYVLIIQHQLSQLCSEATA